MNQAQPVLTGDVYPPTAAKREASHERDKIIGQGQQRGNDLHVEETTLPLFPPADARSPPARAARYGPKQVARTHHLIVQHCIYERTPCLDLRNVRARSILQVMAQFAVPVPADKVATREDAQMVAAATARNVGKKGAGAGGGSGIADAVVAAADMNEGRMM